ncbi:hypothetical protein [Prauserella cavernicola]|uniref:Uncharacterized protein n=1 Tax=Prauserella cavernicola TaxID=2800127 RepID=A0A934V8T6_9PSEU|nr:hypothetical protein [Prauserella cavernicola]MBK1788128.1 hypothetical protein [Prauserella cavernicola]
MISWILRVLVVLGLVGSAWVHWVVWLDWARSTDVVGPLFLVNVVAGVVIALGVLAWWHWLPALLATGFGLATLGAYVLSLTVGLFGVREQFETQQEVWGVVTEAVCVVGGLALLVLFARRRTPAALRERERV